MTAQFDSQPPCLCRYTLATPSTPTNKQSWTKEEPGKKLIITKELGTDKHTDTTARVILHSARTVACCNQQQHIPSSTATTHWPAHCLYTPRPVPTTSRMRKITSPLSMQPTTQASMQPCTLAEQQWGHALQLCNACWIAKHKQSECTPPCASSPVARCLFGFDTNPPHRIALQSRNGSSQEGTRRAHADNSTSRVPALFTKPVCQ